MPLSNEPALQWNGNEVDLYELASPVIDCSWLLVIVSSVIITVLNATFLTGTEFYVGVVGVPILDLLVMLVPLWLILNFFGFISHVQPGGSMAASVLLAGLFVLLAHTTGSITDYYLTVMIQDEYGRFLIEQPGTVEVLTQYGDWVTGLLTLLVSALVGVLLYSYSPRDLIRVIKS